MPLNPGAGSCSGSSALIKIGYIQETKKVDPKCQNKEKIGPIHRIGGWGKLYEVDRIGHRSQEGGDDELTHFLKIGPVKDQHKNR